MTLQQLLRELRAEIPSKRQFVWIVDIDNPKNGDVVSAIANAECELEDCIRDRTGWDIQADNSHSKVGDRHFELPRRLTKIILL